MCFGPRSVRIRLTLGGLGHNWLLWAKVGPDSTTIGAVLTEIVALSTDSGAMPARSGLLSVFAEFGLDWASSAELGARPAGGRMSPKGLPRNPHVFAFRPDADMRDLLRLRPIPCEHFQTAFVRHAFSELFAERMQLSCVAGVLGPVKRIV